MLYESDICNAIEQHHLSLGYEVLQVLKPHERGIDIIARKDKQFLYVEAKGETSWKETSARYGKPFDSTQILSHIGKAIYAALKDLDAKEHSEETVCAIAIPDTDPFLRCIQKVKKSLHKIGVVIYMVSPEGLVRVLS